MFTFNCMFGVFGAPHYDTEVEALHLYHTRHGASE
jgi:hypothetical protein